jgi:hypothetical protein
MPTARLLTGTATRAGMMSTAARESPSTRTRPSSQRCSMACLACQNGYSGSRKASGIIATQAHATASAAAKVKPSTAR